MRHVFFSFHYDDVWRANQVRNMWVVDKQATRFTDSAAFEAVKKQGDTAIKRWIDKQMLGTAVTVVLIGSNTLSRPFVQYEIEQSIKLNKGLLGIHINQLKDNGGGTKRIATTNNLNKYNPTGIAAILSPDKYETKMLPITHLGLVTAHEYIRSNIGDWVEEAAIRAGR